jgi:hypothetical protein
VVGSATTIVQSWLPSIGAVLAGAGALVAALEYRLKAKAQRVEAHVQLAETFARLVPIADGRDGSNHLSETAVANLLASSPDPGTGDDFRGTIVPAVIPGVVGRAAQVAAMSSIADLVVKFPDELKDPGTKALKQLGVTVELAEQSDLTRAYEEALTRIADA